MKIKNSEENIYDLRKKNIIKMETCVTRHRIYNGVIGQSYILVVLAFVYKKSHLKSYFRKLQQSLILKKQMYSTRSLHFVKTLIRTFFLFSFFFHLFVKILLSAFFLYDI